jgi:endonuclease I
MSGKSKSLGWKNAAPPRGLESTGLFLGGKTMTRFHGERPWGLRSGLLAPCLVALTALASGVAASAQTPPPGYYTPVDTTSAASLRATLHPVIDDHQRYPYTSASTDTWDILNLADEDPNDSGKVLTIYKNASYTKIGGGTGAYNREHSWPKSYGFPVDDNESYPYTDCHHLFASDVSYNADRSNKPFRNCSAGCTEMTSDFNDGRGGGSGVYPGNSNWTTGDFSFGTWEVWNSRKGDIARAIFYMDIRYEGGFHGITGFAEPDLILTDDDTLIDAFRTSTNSSQAYMGMLSDLLLWHQQDPVDAREMARNEVVFSFQGNRNPFIDHPEWVDCLYNDLCSGTPDTTPPAAPTGLQASGGQGVVDLGWSANTEPDLAGYRVYRSTASGGPYTQINTGLVSGTSHSDTAVTSGTVYFYVLAAVDTSGNVSSDSGEASATPTGPPPPSGSLVLSEVFYDPAGSDDGLEWVELYNGSSAAIDLAGYSLGNGGTDYTFSTVQLAGVVASGQTFVIGGPTSSAANHNPTFNQVVNFNPDFQNSGSTADGVALFDVPAAQVTASTVPIDAVVYGASNNNGLIDETGAANAPEVGDTPSGSSLERTDLAGSWQIQGAPSPNFTSLEGGPANTAPSVTITGPADASSFEEGTPVPFTGTASDLEDGSLSAAIAWSSDLDGALGTGAAVNTLLSVGTHTITASVTDSGSLGASDSISVTVTPAPPTGNLMLSEVFYDPTGSDNGREWVELYNGSSAAIDLSGYSLGNGGTDYTYSLVQLSGVVGAGQTFVVGGPTSASNNYNPTFNQVVNFNPDFQNSGSTADGVALFDVPAAQVTASTVPIDAVVYGANNSNGLIDETGAANAPEVGDAPSGSSLERTDLAGSWQIQGSPNPNFTGL